MLIVVEGCDRAGKSTLCRNLRYQFGGEILHFSAPDPGRDPVSEYVDPLAAYRPGSGRNLYVDRHYLGELVWPRFFSRESLMDDDKQAQIEGVLNVLGACCVLAVREPRSLNQACVDDEEPPGDRAWLVQLDFQSAAAHSRLPWIEYEQGREGDLEHVVESARDLEVAAATELLLWV